MDGDAVRFLTSIRAARAMRTLATRALLVGRLQPMLMAAREKIRLRAVRAKRQLLGGFWAVRLAVKFMAKVGRCERAHVHKA